MLSQVGLIVLIRLVVDIWRRDARNLFNLFHSLTLYIARQVDSKTGLQPGTKLILIIRVLRNNKTCSFDGTVIVNRSIALQEPVIYVSMNYR